MLVLLGLLFTPAAFCDDTPAKPPDSFWLERFNGTDLKALGWDGGQERDGKKDHVIMTEDGKHFVRSSYIVGTEAKHIQKQVEWDCQQYPFLRWKWRARKFPTGAKILDKKLSDAPAQIYILWKLGRRSTVIKYFWSVSEKVGESFNQGSILFGKLFGLILREGGALNEWHTESRNVFEDYKRAFGVEPPPRVLGVALLSDGDETKSASEADYTDFEALKSVKPAAPTAPAAK